MKVPSKMAETDANLSCQSSEFVWGRAGLSKAHGYLLPTIVRWLKQAGARVVLDLGCGNGAVAAALAAEGYEMTGLDVSESGIAIAARSYPGIPFIQADLSAPLPAPLRERFDTVLAMEVVEHLLLPR